MLPKFVPKSTPTGRTAMIGKEAKPRSNVYLIGPMGSGKTSIGQRLARRLDLEFLDCDHELETQTGASVNLIFDVEGEDIYPAKSVHLFPCER